MMVKRIFVEEPKWKRETCRGSIGSVFRNFQHWKIAIFKVRQLHVLTRDTDICWFWLRVVTRKFLCIHEEMLASNLYILSIIWICSGTHLCLLGSQQDIKLKRFVNIHGLFDTMYILITFLWIVRTDYMINLSLLFTWLFYFMVRQTKYKGS